MQLSELFVSHKQVEPVTFTAPTTEAYQPLYINLNRAQQVTNSPTSEDIPEESEDVIRDWRTKQDNTHWKVSSQTDRITQPTQNNGNNMTHVSNSKRAQYWMNQFANFGANTNQQLALVSAMMTECGLNPKGAVEKKELAGKGNTKAGWAHAGEGAVGFTHWDLKKRMIERFNADPRRKGAPLPTTEAEYAKDNARHIADLDDEDHALMTYLFYEDLLKTTQNMNFNDMMGEFYMQKAGRGYGQRAGAGKTPYEKAIYTGKVYQQSHAKLGYHKAAQTNTFLKSMDYAKGLANTLGYTI